MILGDAFGAPGEKVEFGRVVKVVVAVVALGTFAEPLRRVAAMQAQVADRARRLVPTGRMIPCRRHVDVRERVAESADRVDRGRREPRRVANFEHARHGIEERTDPAEPSHFGLSEMESHGKLCEQRFELARLGERFDAVAELAHARFDLHVGVLAS